MFGVDPLVVARRDLDDIPLMDLLYQSAAADIDSAEGGA